MAHASHLPLLKAFLLLPYLKTIECKRSISDDDELSSSELRTRRRNATQTQDRFIEERFIEDISELALGGKSLLALNTDTSNGSVKTRSQCMWARYHYMVPKAYDWPIQNWRNRFLPIGQPIEIIYKVFHLGQDADIQTLLCDEWDKVTVIPWVDSDEGDEETDSTSLNRLSHEEDADRFYDHSGGCKFTCTDGHWKLDTHGCICAVPIPRSMGHPPSRRKKKHGLKRGGSPQQLGGDGHQEASDNGNTAPHHADDHDQTVPHLSEAELWPFKSQQDQDWFVEQLKDFPWKEWQPGKDLTTAERNDYSLATFDWKIVTLLNLAQQEGRLNPRGHFVNQDPQFENYVYDILHSKGYDYGVHRSAEELAKEFVTHLAEKADSQLVANDQVEQQEVSDHVDLFSE